jgi:group I intron endonuclease
MAYIYSITNTINRKSYIGLTRKDNPTDRWKQHIKNTHEGKLDYPIYRAMKKYGTHNFRFKVLEECSEDKVAERERHFIKELNTYGDDGYNATYGGEGWNNKELKSIGITSYTIEGEKIKDYDSMTDAGDDLGVDVTLISRVVNGLQTTTNNLRFSKQGEEPVPIRTNKGARNKTPIYGYNKEGEYNEWDSIYQFAKENDIKRNSMKGIYNSIRSDNSNKKQCRGWYLFEKTDDSIIQWSDFSLSKHFRWTSDEYRKRVNYDAEECSRLGKIGASRRWNKNEKT